MSRVRQIREAAQARKRVEPRPEGRSSRAVAGKPHRDEVLGYWLLPLPTIDPAIVARSGAALPSYGPKFRYSHYAGTKTLRYAAGGAAVMAGLGLAAQVKPPRNLLMRLVPSRRRPRPERPRASWFTVDFVGEAGGETVHTRVSGGDPGYTETAKMLAESGAVPGLRRQPRRGRAGDHRPGDGRQPAGPAAGGRADVRGALTGQSSYSIR